MKKLAVCEIDPVDQYLEGLSRQRENHVYTTTNFTKPFRPPKGAAKISRALAPRKDIIRDFGKESMVDALERKYRAFVNGDAETCENFCIVSKDSDDEEETEQIVHEKTKDGETVSKKGNHFIPLPTNPNIRTERVAYRLNPETYKPLVEYGAPSDFETKTQSNEEGYNGHAAKLAQKFNQYDKRARRLRAKGETVDFSNSIRSTFKKHVRKASLAVQMSRLMPPPSQVAPQPSTASRTSFTVSTIRTPTRSTTKQSSIFSIFSKRVRSKTPSSLSTVRNTNITNKHKTRSLKSAVGSSNPVPYKPPKVPILSLPIANDPDQGSMMSKKYQKCSISATNNNNGDRCDSSLSSVVNPPPRLKMNLVDHPPPHSPVVVQRRTFGMRQSESGRKSNTNTVQSIMLANTARFYPSSPSSQSSSQQQQQPSTSPLKPTPPSRERPASARDFRKQNNISQQQQESSKYSNFNAYNNRPGSVAGSRRPPTRRAPLANGNVVPATFSLMQLRKEILDNQKKNTKHVNRKVLEEVFEKNKSKPPNDVEKQVQGAMEEIEAHREAWKQVLPPVFGEVSTLCNEIVRYGDDTFVDQELKKALVQWLKEENARKLALRTPGMRARAANEDNTPSVAHSVFSL
eukprot:TRINITY_DN361_c0_g1_i11.p3 TRINITY_DN361_c0_g1~~TRINITY_DN361_c0_g1_i11.p3  ORF type:complete len:630 (-),score=151.51 TRINITY_DN361_c0_g1_i11:5086-6975(-)